AIDGLDDHLGLPDLQFIAFPAHGLDQDRKVQYPPAEDHELIGTVRRLHPEGQILFQLPLQTFLDVPGGHKLSILSEKGTVIDGEEHAHGRLINGNGLQLLRILKIGHGVPDLKALHAHYGTDVPGGHFTDLYPAQTFEGIELLGLGLDDLPVPFYQGNVLAFLENAPLEPTNGDPSGKGGKIQGGDQQLGGPLYYLE